jgi:dethiobiotin synthetase
MPLRGLFITGTDTGVGKTYVAVRLIRILRERGLRVGAYKPAVTGSESGPAGPVWDDLARLRDALGEDLLLERICPQRFHAPLAPPVAARLEGKQINGALLRSGIDWWRGRSDFVVVEGAGGLLSPIAETESVADVAKSFGFPLVIVARLSLGTINHTLLTLEAAQRRKLAVAGVVLNQAVADPGREVSAETATTDAGCVRYGAADLSVETNAEELRKRCGVPILAILPYAPAADLLQDSPLSTIDWERLGASCLWQSDLV